MKLLLLLVLVLSQSPVTHQESEEKTSENGDVSLVNRDLLDTVPEVIIHHVTTATHRRILSPANSRGKRQVKASQTKYDNGNLKWELWGGSLPSAAVSVDKNQYTHRVDYICKHGCHSGFYSPKMGSYCFYPLAKKELKSSSFEILVNTDKFEVLEWKQGSQGSVPQNSVRTCSSDEVYVGKNVYGLGMVARKQKLFYLPWSGSLYSYSTYQVLTINKNVERQDIDKVVYNKKNANVIQTGPETMRVFTVTNNECRPVSKVVSLSKTVKEENKWDIGDDLTVGNTKTFSGGVPHLVSSHVIVSADTSFQLSKGNTMTEEVTHSASVILEVPPNSNCKIRMMGYKSGIKIPFTARLSRTYSDRKTTSTSITGMYNSAQFAKLKVKVDRCVLGANDCA